MGREGTQKPAYEILAIVTLHKERILCGNQLSMLAKDEAEQELMTVDIAKAMKADVVKMKSGDYLVIRL